MNNSKQFAYMRSRKLVFCLFSSIFLFLCSLSKKYNDSISRQNHQVDYDILSGGIRFHGEQNKVTLKDNFHLNIFDFQSFKSVKWQESSNSGPCVNTRIEVSRILEEIKVK